MESCRCEAIVLGVIDYREADKLSRRNKEFIKELFPSSDLYATLFAERARRLIGQVGARGAIAHTSGEQASA